MKNQLILTDCDGVLLSWEYSFDRWMHRKGFSQSNGIDTSYCIGERYGINKEKSKKLIEEFNNSSEIAFLPPFRDAVKYVKQLHEQHGFVFYVITSLSLESSSVKLREQNLKRVFGETVFEQIVCLATGADKDHALKPFENSGCFWVEDKWENAILGSKMGLVSLLLEHNHNKHMDTASNLHRIRTWADAYTLITQT